MRLLSFGESATLLVRRSSARRALYADWLPADLVEALWRQPAALIARAEVLQQRGVRRTVRLDWGSRSFVLKRYVEPSWRHALKRLVARSRASLTWQISHLLADSGILTPRPVACVENRWGGLGLDSYLMYPYVKGETVLGYLHRQPEPARQAARIVRQCDELWQKLTTLGASLQDANPGNFIVTSTNELWVIDLDKARRFRSQLLAEWERRRTWRQFMQGMARTLNNAPWTRQTLPYQAAA